jgi:hypothetical protein
MVLGEVALKTSNLPEWIVHGRVFANGLLKNTPEKSAYVYLWSRNGRRSDLTWRERGFG